MSKEERIPQTRFFKYSLLGKLFRFSGFYSTTVVLVIIFSGRLIDNSSAEISTALILVILMFGYVTALIYYLRHPIFGISEEGLLVKIFFKNLKFAWKDINIVESNRNLSRLLFPVKDIRFTYIYTNKSYNVFLKLFIALPVIEEYDVLLEEIKKAKQKG